MDGVVLTGFFAALAGNTSELTGPVGNLGRLRVAAAYGNRRSLRKQLDQAVWALGYAHAASRALFRINDTKPINKADCVKLAVPLAIPQPVAGAGANLGPSC